jgi:hypothetical protein
MKKISLASFLLLIISINFTFAQKGGFSFSFNINSMWGNWQPASERILGNYNDLVIVEGEYTHPSDYYVRITLDNFELIKDTNYKKRLKNNQWYEYTGTIEYFEIDNPAEWHTTFEDRIKSNIGLSFGAPTANDRDKKGFRAIKKPAIIKIAPYKEYPIIYNIFFDNYGIAIDLTPPFGYF